jgi:phosphohistidine swiveling domain-containing protein
MKTSICSFAEPSLIGANIATQVLKDGYVVEVDAEKGVVGIIK